MKPLFIGIGLCLLGLGSLVSFVGHYDGVLGADDPESFLSTDASKDITLRIAVLGDASEADRQFRAYERDLLVPTTMSQPLSEGRWVPVRLMSTDAEAFLQVRDAAPAPGTVLVFEGDIKAYWPMYDVDAQILGKKPILFLKPDDYHPPLLFKA